jgi:hypothetical protein
VISEEDYNTYKLLPETAKQLRKICKEKTDQEESIFNLTEINWVFQMLNENQLGFHIHFFFSTRGAEVLGFTDSA